MKRITSILLAVFLLLLLVAVIVTLPAFLAFTFPLESTVAIFLLEDFHFTFLELLIGEAAADKIIFSPIFIFTEDLFMESFVTFVAVGL